MLVKGSDAHVQLHATTCLHFSFYVNNIWNLLRKYPSDGMVGIDPFHESRNESDKYPTTQHFMTEIVHISVCMSAFVNNIWYLLRKYPSDGMVGIDPSHESRNASDKYPTMQHFITEIVRISVCMSVFVNNIWNLLRKYPSDGMVGIDPSHESRNASDKYPTMQHFITEIVRISVTKWCIAGYGIGTLWDYKIGILKALLILVKCPICLPYQLIHYGDVIMDISSQITSLTIVYSTVYSDADQRKHQSSTSLAFVRGIHRSQMASNAENVSIWWRHHMRPD